mgnify:CR=1 FL=1
MFSHMKCNIRLCYVMLQTGATALFFAAQNGSVDICDALIAAGAEIDIPCYVSLITLR